MAQFNFILTLLISFFGLFVGVFLISNAPEELDSKKYFILFKHILFVLISLVFIFDNSFGWLSLFVLLYYFLSKSESKDIVSYAFLGAVFYFSFNNPNVFLLQSSLIALYGFPTGTLIRAKTIKKHWKYSVLDILKYYWIYLAVAMILFFLNV